MNRGLLDEKPREVEDEGVRFLLRKNPTLAAEAAGMDGCDPIETDLSHEANAAQTVHDRH
ncbi:MAG: hypothetical protein KKB20_14930 [Proteobacteria bacterium]|nr:hypothetical protein [Pseudomonadota bacterium]